MAPLAYMAQRTDLAKRIFEDTMSELSFAGIQGILLDTSFS